MEIPKNITVLVDETLGKVGLQLEIDIYPSCRNTRITVLETAPQTRTIKLVDSTFRATGGKNWFFHGEKRFYLAFPYMQFVFISGRFAVAFKNEPGNPFGQLIFPSLPNVYSHGRVCFGMQHIAFGSSVENAIETLGLFWTSPFDLFPHDEWFGLKCLEEIFVKDKCVDSFLAWEKATRKDPGFIMSVDWPEKFTMLPFIKSRIY